jgi:hypothetical protein
MKTHCFGFSELDGKFAFTTGYCIDADQDGDKVVWKRSPSKDPKDASTLKGSAEVLMAS